MAHPPCPHMGPSPLFSLLLALFLCCCAVGRADEYPIGSFNVLWNGSTVVVMHPLSPNVPVWATVSAPFLQASLSTLHMHELEGMFTTEDLLQCSSISQTVSDVASNLSAVRFQGYLTFETSCPIHTLPFTLVFSACASSSPAAATPPHGSSSTPHSPSSPALPNHLCVSLQATLPQPAPTSNLSLAIAINSPANEAVRGFGVQYSVWDFKGRVVPILVSEQGIGRGLQPVTAILNAVSLSGGNWHTTYAPIPHYITSRNLSFALENTEYSIFDLSSTDRINVQVFSNTLSGRIFAAESPLAAVREYTLFSGRMNPLPAWITQGAVVGYEGGTDAVLAMHALIKSVGVPVAAFWMQDWTGKRIEPGFGERLWWNWEADPVYYHNWTQLCSTLAADGARVLTYINPYLANTVTRDKPHFTRDLFREAASQGFLVKDAAGAPYILASGGPGFTFGTIDATNPAAREWYANIIVDNMIGQQHSGWMADFGEYLPFDAALAVGEGPVVHNAFPTLWAQINRGAISNATDAVFFMRSGYTQSPASATLFWLGDQLVTWDGFDGIRSAVTGMLNAGLSGFALSHSDIGGYTMVHEFGLDYVRGEELLLRWMELNAVSDSIFRSHPGNLPNRSSQVYSNNRTLQCFGRMATLHKALATYRYGLMQEHVQTGAPLIRPLWMLYPLDAAASSITDTILLGEDVVAAPVVDPDTLLRRLFLPAGNWTNMWTGKQYSQGPGEIIVEAPVGTPAVFYRTGSSVGDDLRTALADMLRFQCQ